jgi:signal transduction histidine kinase
MRSRAWRTGAVTELVAALGEAPARGELRVALADALADPTVELAYWLPERGGYVDADGRSVQLPEGGPGAERIATEVERDGRRVGALIHDPAVCDDPELVSGVATAAALALDNERLGAELRARVEELHASRQRILEAGLAERRRLERDLHDGAQQRLVSLSLQLGLVDARLERDPAGARAVLESAREEARAALDELRELARGIHPAVLTDRGLGAALEALAARSAVPVELAALPQERLPPAVEAAAYFVVAESLTNVAKYARASHAQVRVERRDGAAYVEVRDDGAGGADLASGSGLRGLADRLAALDGRLRVDSPPGRGTLVRAEVPCASS